MDRAIFIYNPKSGPGGIAGKLDYIIGRFMEKGVLVQPFRMGADHGDRLLELLKNEKYSSAVVSGGDGTVSSVVNLILGSSLNIPLGIIPAGTCNDFARSLNIPADVKRCLDIILAGRTAEVDVGLINGKKYFVGTCAGGNLVDVSFTTSTDLKRNFGPLAYYFKALSELPGIKPVKLKVITDDETIDQEFLFFLIINGRHAGGFSNVIKEAEISDGMMDILLLGNCLHIDMPTLFIKVLNNDLVNDPRVMWLRTQNCRIEGSGELPITVDGERGDSLPMSIKFINKAIKVFVK